MEHIAVAKLELLDVAGLLRPTETDSSITYQLQRLTKIELSLIRKQLKLKGVSQLNKPQLVAALAEAIVAAVPAQLKLLDEVLHRIVRELVENRGVINDLSNIGVSSLMLLRRMGLAFTGLLPNDRVTVIMPQEVLGVCRRLLADTQLRDTIRHNQQLVLATRGLLTYYGALRYETLIKMLEGIDLPVEKQHLIDLFHTPGKRHGYFDVQADMVSDRRVLSPEDILETHVLAHKYGYYPISQEKALLAARYTYVDWVEEHRLLLDYFMDEHDLDEEEAAEEVIFLIFAFNNRIPIPTLLVRFEESGMDLSGYDIAAELLSLVADAYEETRLWFYCGYTPREIKEMESRPHLRVLPSPQKNPVSSCDGSPGGN